jgi:hypothetical protein
MRTTIELTAEQHEGLAAMAARRKLRGFSALVQEAVDAYLTAHANERIGALPALEGSVSDDDAAELRTRIAELWHADWRAPA